MSIRFCLSALAVCAALTLTGCELLEDIITGHSHPQPPKPTASCEVTGPATIVQLNRIRVASDPFELSEAVIEDDVLCVSVEYGGGCADHNFNLLVNSEMTDGTPQVNALLTHNSHGDACDALIMRKVGFDLTPLREHLRKTTGQTSGTVALHLSGYNTQQVVLYTY